MFRRSALVLIFSILSAWAEAQVEKGVISLQHWQERDTCITLSGDWSMVRGVRVRNSNQLAQYFQAHFQEIPGYFSEDNPDLPVNGVASYILALDGLNGRSNLGLQLNGQISGSIALYDPGASSPWQSLLMIGVPAEVQHGHIPDVIPKTAIKLPLIESDRVYLVVTVSAYYQEGSIRNPPVLGDYDFLARSIDQERARNFFIAGILFLMGCLSLILYWRRPEDKAFIYLGVFTFASILHFLAARFYLSWLWGGATFFWNQFNYKVLFHYVNIAGPLYLLFVFHSFPGFISKRIMNGIVVYTVGSVVVTHFMPIDLRTFSLICLAVLPINIFAVGTLICLVLKKKEGSWFAIFGTCCLFITVVYDMLIGNNVINGELLYPYGLMVFIFMQNLIMGDRFARTFQEREGLRQNLKQQTTIAQTGQMLAHDVRKPFSLLYMGLEQLRMADHPDKMAHITEKLLPAVKKSMTQVDVMIEDLMAMGRRLDTNCKPCSLSTIISDAISETSNHLENKFYRFSFDFRHDHLINVDGAMIQRVISNILQNAIEATSGNEDITFRSVEGNNGMITVAIRNSGSSIDQNDIAHIFDAFYTQNKQRGTGLGMAIAKRIVLEHGGRIWAESSREDPSVTFCFTLPLADQVDELSIKLPTNSDESRMTILHIEEQGLARISREKLDIERDLVNTLRSCNEVRLLCVLDDDTTYSDALDTMIQQVEGVAQFLEVRCFDNPEEFMPFVLEANPDVIICDVDLGVAYPSGFDLVEQLRNKGFRNQICVHSNRALEEDYRRTFEAGGNSFISKPINRTLLFKFLLNALKPEDKVIPPKPVTANPKNVVVLDDEDFALSVWREKFEKIGSKVETFTDPDAFAEAVFGKLIDLAQVNLIITDYYFEKTNVVDVGLVPFLRNRNYEGPIFLSSHIGSQGKVEGFDKLISKNASIEDFL